MSKCLTPKQKTAAVKGADTLNNIEGVPVTVFAKEFSAKWAKGKITGAQMQAVLFAKHRKVS